MPAYNCEKYIKQAIETILGQTYRNFELLISDDCSTDRTKEIIDGYTDERIKCFHNSSNLGYLKASNKLFEKCSGEYITFQDADDYSDPHRLEKLIYFLSNNSDIDCVGSNISKVDVDGHDFFKSNFPLQHSEILETFKNRKVVMTGSSLMIRKYVIDKVGVYNEYFDRLGSEDVYWFSLILEKFKVANLPDVLYYYRANPNSVGGTFKDPRSKVLHNLSVKLFIERANGNTDPIKNANFDLANRHCSSLLLIEEAKRNKWSAFLKSISLFLFNLNLFKLYGKDFYFALVKL